MACFFPCFFCILRQFIRPACGFDVCRAHCFKLGVFAQGLTVILIAHFQVFVSLYLTVNDFKVQPESLVQYFKLFIDIRLCILQIAVFVNEIIESIYRPVRYSYRIFGLLFGILHALPHLVLRVYHISETFPVFVGLDPQLCKLCLRFFRLYGHFSDR